MAWFGGSISGAVADLLWFFLKKKTFVDKKIIFHL